MSLHRLLNFVVLLLLIHPSFGKRHADLLWSCKNSFFSDYERTSSSASISVEFNDELTIACPHYEFPLPKNAEVSKIYMVSDMAYLNCQLDSSAEEFLACDKPRQPKNRKIVFRPYSPLPNGLEFAAGKSYYLITTSNGTKSGLNGRFKGLCASSNLRLRIDVAARMPSTSAPSTPAPETLEFLRDSHDSVVILVSEQYNSDEVESDPKSSTETPRIQNDSRFALGSRQISRAQRTNIKPGSVIDEAYSRQLDLAKFQYVLNMAQNGAVGSISFSNGEISSVPSVVAEKKAPKPDIVHIPVKKVEESSYRSDFLTTFDRNNHFTNDYVIQNSPENPLQDSSTFSSKLHLFLGLLVLVLAIF
ncbi:hypothetical protein L596_008343 [Steinernema carpocapsae]|uniref:Ephrin RBD domain-containing protein n=1 Tax=Steinernema carpocapsae TaxID=34508 RepID=A0A4V6A6B5_STECR|nr:hypothetical protein L596_008343 [Steinernema carpocapsae]